MTEADRASFDAFMLGIRVMSVAFELDAPASQFERPFELLRELADGRLTIAAPGEMAAKFPQLGEFIQDRSREIIESDRATAARILRGLSAAL